MVRCGRWRGLLLGGLLGVVVGAEGPGFPLGIPELLCSAPVWGAPFVDPTGNPGGTAIPKEEARRRVMEILERQTLFRWGDDCLIWMVHYPPDLVEPWVALEASKRGLSPEDAAQYRDSFVRDLRLGDLEPFLFTVYVFGDTPVSLQPFKERVVLAGASGDMAPVSVESRLDGALTGIVQGLIFFPKQPGGNFTVKVRPGESPEFLQFAFRGAAEELSLAASSDAPLQVVVAKVPEPRSSAVPSPVPPEKPSRKRVSPAPEIKPTPTVEPPPDFLVLPPAARVEPSGPPQPQAAPPSPMTESRGPSPAARPSEDKVLSADGGGRHEGPPAVLATPEKDRLVSSFLKYWVAGDGENMYALLSAQSRKLLSGKDFAAQARQHSFRWALKDGYRLAWLDEGTVRVSAAQKLLVMRVLKTHILRVVREQGGWRVVW